MRLAEFGVFISAVLVPILTSGWWRVGGTHLSGLLMLVGAGFSAHVFIVPGVLFLFVCAAFLSCLFSWSPRNSILPGFRRGDGWLTLCCYALIAITALNMPAQHRDILLRCVVLMLSCLSVLYLVRTRVKRVAKWSLSNYGFISGQLVLLLPMAADIRWGWAVCLMCSALFVTGTRAAMLASVIAFLWIGWSNLWMIPWALGGLLIGYAVDSVSTVERFTTSQIQEGLADRVWLWGNVLRRIAYKPLFGWGQNTMLVHDSIPAPYGRRHDLAHCDPLEILYTFGIVGALCYAGIWWHALNHPINAVTAGLASYAVWGVFCSSMLGNWNLLYLMLAMGMVR